MHKFKCEKCDHVSGEKGFCPKDGSELVETKDFSSDDKSVEALLSGLGKILSDKVDEAVKGLTPADNKAIHSDKMPTSLSEKYAYVKGILNEKDQAVLASQKSEEKELKFLAQARGAYFFKHLIAFQISKDPEHLQHVKALAEGVPADGGYLTPTEFRAQLVEDLKDAGFLRSKVTVIPMNSDALELPTLLSSVQVSWGSENTSISTTTARFGTLTFTPYRLNTLIYTSRELASDSALNVIQLLTRLIREAIGREEDRVIVNGSGSGQPKGILQETLGGIDNGNDDTTLAVNVKKLPFLLGTAYRQKAEWLMNSLSMAAIASLRDATSGQFLFKEGIEGLSPHRLAGYPVSEQNDMPLDTLLFGDFSQYYLGDREQMIVETTTEGAGTFEKHQVAIKVTERIDGKVAQTNAFKKITNAGID